MQPMNISTTTTFCKICVHGWQCQTASLKGSNHLPSKVRHEFSSVACHAPGFELNRTCLVYARPSCTGSWTSCTKLVSIGSSIASGMAAATTAAHPATGGMRQCWGRHPRTWWLHLILNFEPWMSLSDSKFTFYKWNNNLIVQYELWRSILQMDIFSVKTGLVIVWQSIH
jgi:hypothetical protein